MVHLSSCAAETRECADAAAERITKLEEEAERAAAQQAAAAAEAAAALAATQQQHADLEADRDTRLAAAQVPVDGTHALPCTANSRCSADAKRVSLM